MESVFLNVHFLLKSSGIRSLSIATLNWKTTNVCKPQCVPMCLCTNPRVTHTRSVEHHTQGIISNASSSGFSPHFYVSHFLCMMCPRAHLISQSSYFPHAKKNSIFQRKGYRHCSIDKIDFSSSDSPKHKIQQIPNRIPSIEEKIHSKWKWNHQNISVNNYY